MKRREEIERAANEFYKGDEVSTFVVAAQWADRTMLDKAVEWITEHLEIPYEGQPISYFEKKAESFYEWVVKNIEI